MASATTEKVAASLPPVPPIKSFNKATISHSLSGPVLSRAVGSTNNSGSDALRCIQPSPRRSARRGGHQARFMSALDGSRSVEGSPNKISTKANDLATLGTQDSRLSSADVNGNDEYHKSAVMVGPSTVISTSQQHKRGQQSDWDEGKAERVLNLIGGKDKLVTMLWLVESMKLGYPANRSTVPAFAPFIMKSKPASSRKLSHTESVKEGPTTGGDESHNMTLVTTPKSSSAATVSWKEDKNTFLMVCSPLFADLVSPLIGSASSSRVILRADSRSLQSRLRQMEAKEKAWLQHLVHKRKQIGGNHTPRSIQAKPSAGGAGDTLLGSFSKRRPPRPSTPRSHSRLKSQHSADGGDGGQQSLSSPMALKAAAMTSKEELKGGSQSSLLLRSPGSQSAVRERFEGSRRHKKSQRMNFGVTVLFILPCRRMSSLAFEGGAAASRNADNEINSNLNEVDIEIALKSSPYFEAVADNINSLNALQEKFPYLSSQGNRQTDSFRRPSSMSDKLSSDHNGRLELSDCCPGENSVATSDQAGLRASTLSSPVKSVNSRLSIRLLSLDFLDECYLSGKMVEDIEEYLIKYDTKTERFVFMYSLDGCHTDECDGDEREIESILITADKSPDTHSSPRPSLLHTTASHDSGLFPSVKGHEAIAPRPPLRRKDEETECEGTPEATRQCGGYDGRSNSLLSTPLMTKTRTTDKPLGGDIGIQHGVSSMKSSTTVPSTSSMGTVLMPTSPLTNGLLMKESSERVAMTTSTTRTTVGGLDYYGDVSGSENSQGIKICIGGDGEGQEISEEGSRDSSIVLGPLSQSLPSSPISHHNQIIAEYPQFDQSSLRSSGELTIMPNAMCEGTGSVGSKLRTGSKRGRVRDGDRTSSSRKRRNTKPGVLSCVSQYSNGDSEDVECGSCAAASTVDESRSEENAILQSIRRSKKSSKSRERSSARRHSHSKRKSLKSSLGPFETADQLSLSKTTRDLHFFRDSLPSPPAANEMSTSYGDVVSENPIGHEKWFERVSLDERGSREEMEIVSLALSKVNSANCPGNDSDIMEPCVRWGHLEDGQINTVVSSAKSSPFRKEGGREVNCIVVETPRRSSLSTLIEGGEGLSGSREGTEQRLRRSMRTGSERSGNSDFIYYR